MKKFTILISFLIPAVLAIGQIANDDQTFFDYTYNKSIIKTNKIKTVTIETSFPSGKSSSKSTYHFDKDGLLTKESIIDSGGKLLLEYYFFTNTHGDLIYRIENDYRYKRVDTVKFFKSYSDDKLIKDSSSQLPISYNYEYDLNESYRNIKLLNSICSFISGGYGCIIFFTMCLISRCLL
jgi:hypothetical protein